MSCNKLTNRQLQNLDKTLGKSALVFLKDEDQMLNRFFIGAIISARTGKRMDAVADTLPADVEEFTDVAINEITILSRSYGLDDEGKKKGRVAATKVKR